MIDDDPLEHTELTFLLGMAFQLTLAEFVRRLDAEGYDDLRPVHGLAEVPADIVQLVCDFAIAGMNTAGNGSRSGVTSEAVDDYRVTYADGEDAQASVVEIPERTRLMLRQRFGGGTYVVTPR